MTIDKREIRRRPKLAAGYRIDASVVVNLQKWTGRKKERKKKPKTFSDFQPVSKLFSTTINFIVRASNTPISAVYTEKVQPIRNTYVRGLRFFFSFLLFLSRFSLVTTFVRRIFSRTFIFRTYPNRVFGFSTVTSASPRSRKTRRRRRNVCSGSSVVARAVTTAGGENVSSSPFYATDAGREDVKNVPGRWRSSRTRRGAEGTKATDDGVTVAYCAR